MTPPRIVHGDCLEVMKMLPNDSVDSIVTDPPYGLGFMGKAWDALPPGQDWAEECLRVLKPGGHLLAFGGTRTWHRLAVAVEDAGFEIRDSIAWQYGSGFPKSRNISADKLFCQCEGTDGSGDMHRVRDDIRDAGGMVEAGQEPDMLAAVQRRSAGAGVGDSWAQGGVGAEDLHSDVRSGQPGMEGRHNARSGQGELCRAEVRSMPSRVADDGAEGRVHHGASASDGTVGGPTATADGSREPYQPEPAGQSSGKPGAVPVERGPQARRGRKVCAGCSKPLVSPGLGTALKPAFEPIVMARKPFKGTVAANVQTHGTGALNIDGCRIGIEGATARSGQAAYPLTEDGKEDRSKSWARTGHEVVKVNSGRWPANVVLDEHMAGVLDGQTQHLHGAGAARDAIREAGATGMFPLSGDGNRFGDSGGASRFFYVAKASKSERPVVDAIAHPTVKPLALMRWLVRLVTPEGGTVLEPFAGSGATVEACILEGFHCIAIEREAEYLPLIQARIDRQDAA